MYMKKRRRVSLSKSKEPLVNDEPLAKMAKIEESAGDKDDELSSHEFSSSDELMNSSDEFSSDDLSSENINNCQSGDLSGL